MTTAGILILITQVITLATAALAFWASRKNKAAIHSVHVSINSRMDELLKVTASASRAEGVIEGEANSTAKK